jgi:hypothetical protein
MSEQVAFFRIDEGASASRSASAASEVRAPAAPATPARKTVTPTVKPVAAAGGGIAASRRGPVAAMHSKLATALQDSEWKDF